MSAPSVTARQTPVGIHLEDGFKTKIACAADPDISFWEKTVQPPGFDGGDLIEQTTMHNTLWRTKAPRQLLTLTDCAVVAAYDPAILTQVQALINVETAWTIHHPDLSTWAFFGVLKDAKPSAHQEGEQPTIAITIVPTNWDPVGKVEAGPALVSVAGT